MSFPSTILPQYITAIYDAATSTDLWSAALDAFLDGSDADAALLYEFDRQRPLSYSRQAVDTLFGQREEIIEGYNQLIACGRNAGSDIEAFEFIHQREPFSSTMDEEIWTLDDDFRSRPEIAYTIEKVGVFRRFLVNLSDDPIVQAGLISLYPKTMNAPPHRNDRAHMEILAPHLAKALEMNRIFRGLRQKYNAVLAVLDRIAAPICLLDRYGHILLENDAASELFTAKKGCGTGSLGT